MKTHSKRTLLMILLLSTFLGSLGQLAFKVGLMTSAWYIFAGLMAYAISTVIFLYVLSRTHLSWTYGIGGLSYVFASILAFFVLGEQITPVRWVGIIVIAVGTALVGLS